MDRAIRILRYDFQFQRIIAIADSAPEGDSGGVGDEDFDGQPRRLRADFGAN
jgi:hypothetical protein